MLNENIESSNQAKIEDSKQQLEHYKKSLAAVEKKISDLQLEQQKVIKYRCGRFEQINQEFVPLKSAKQNIENKVQQLQLDINELTSLSNINDLLKQ